MIRSVYMNNTKVANVITSIDDFSQELAITEFGKDKKDICSYLNFATDDGSELKSITRFDLMVMDAVYALHVSGRRTFTLEMLANTIACKEVSLEKTTSSKLRNIKESMEKMRRIFVSIDYTDIKRATGEIIEDDKYILNDNLIPAAVHIVKSKVKKRNKIEYEMERTPILYRYAQDLGRIINIPTKILTLNGIREDDDFLVLKHQLIKEIAVMKNTRNNFQNRIIKYEWANGEQGGFVHRIGLDKNNYTNDVQWKKRKVKLTNHIEVILNHLIEVKYIKGYEHIKEGKSVVGFEINT